MMAVTRELRAPALPASLDDIQDLLAELWSVAGGVTAADRMRFESAVVEIAGNIIEHARPAPHATIVTLRLAVDCGPNALRAVLGDDGRPADVDLDVVTMPGLDAESGRGLALATALSDSLRFERLPTENRWTVECARSG